MVSLYFPCAIRTNMGDYMIQMYHSFFPTPHLNDLLYLLHQIRHQWRIIPPSIVGFAPMYFVKIIFRNCIDNILDYLVQLFYPRWLILQCFFLSFLVYGSFAVLDTHQSYLTFYNDETRSFFFEQLNGISYVFTTRFLLV